MKREDVRQLAAHLEQRALWYERPGDFRSGVMEMARSCEDWLTHDGSSKDGDEERDQQVRVS